MSKTVIVWFRNDLRVRDNEALWQAVQNANYVIPIYCFDPRQFEKTAHFDLPKTGSFRAQFLIDAVQDLRYALQDLGANLIIRTGKPEDIIYALAKYHKVSAVYCHEEACSEENKVADALDRHLDTLNIPLHFSWGSTLYHFDDLPISLENLPNVFTQFRKIIEKEGSIRNVFDAPPPFSLLPNVDAGQIPTLKDLGLSNVSKSKKGVLPFKGGETAALLRLKHYFWESDQLRNYKKNRNGLLGANYSSKFSPWLALGCISPRTIQNSIWEYEQKRIKNQSTYWLYFELLWRDYFRFIAVKYGNAIFKKGGIRKQVIPHTKDWAIFEKWMNGQTGIPFIDANMLELKHTGFMSNRGRQNVASFLVKDLKLHWLMGAEYFESMLIDYDPCSNYGNWNYVAGIGNDSRTNRYFNVLKQAHLYDSEGNYVKHWLPILKALPSTRVHEPYLLKKIEQKHLKLHLGKHYPLPCFDITQWRAKQINSQ